MFAFFPFAKKIFSSPNIVHEPVSQQGLVQQPVISSTMRVFVVAPPLQDL